MTTLHGKNGKIIQYSFNNSIHQCSNNMCIIEMPFVVCNNRKDAELIQTEVSAFISNLSKKLSKE